MGLTSILNVSKQGLFANQGSLKVVSHNIANVNTPGFTRQQAVLAANPNKGSLAGAGDGVTLTGVRRNVDEMVDSRLVLAQQEMGRMEARDRFLPLIEDVFNDLDGDGLAVRLEKLYDSAEFLADNPSNPVGRKDFLSQAESLSLFIKNMANAMDRAAMPVDEEITYTLNDINTRLDTLQQVNSSIIKQEGTNSPALDLKDQRTELVRELSNLMDVQVIDNGDGGITLLSRGGKMLMERDYRAQFYRGGAVDENGYLGIRYNDQLADITSQIRGGQLKGLLEIRDEVINGDSGWSSRLETLADEIRYQFNAIHSQSVGSRLNRSQTGEWDVGAALNTPINALVTDKNATGYAGTPQDMGRVTDGTLVLGVGPDGDNLSRTAITINATDTIQQVVDKINAVPGLNATLTSNRRVQITTAGNDGFGVVSDSSGVMAAMGMGVLFTGNGSTDMGVSGELLGDILRVGAGRITDDGTALVYDDLNNRGALALSDLRSAKVDLFDKSATLTAHYAGITGELGSLKQQNDSSLTAQEESYRFISDFRESISGVSLDEELTDLIRFQRAFQASSRMVSLADELMQSIIEMV